MMKKKSYASLVSSLITFLVGIFGGLNMIERGSTRPGWLMLIACSVGAIVFLVKIVLKNKRDNKENAI